MQLVLGTRRDPILEQGDLFRAQSVTVFRGRHHLLLVFGLDPEDQFTVLWLARHDGMVAIEIAPRTILGVEPQVRFARLLIRPMTGKAMLRKDRADLAIKVRRLPCPGRSRDGNRQRQGQVRSISQQIQRHSVQVRSAILQCATIMAGPSLESTCRPELPWERA